MKRIGYIDGRRIVGRISTGVSGVSRGMQITQIYDPPTEGYETTIGFAGKAQLAAGKKFTGGQGFMWGLQGQLDFQGGSELDQANAIFAALRGVITASGTPIFTDFDTVAGIYCDNLCPIDLAGIATGYGSALASLQNHGGTLDHGILLRGGNKITNVFGLNTFGGAIFTGERGGNVKNIKIDIDGDTWYINVYDT